MFLNQVCSIHSKVLSCLMCLGMGQNKVLGAPCLNVYISKLVNLFTLSDVSAGQCFMWKELREKQCFSADIFI